MRKARWTWLKWASLGVSLGSLSIAALLLGGGESQVPPPAPPASAPATQIEKVDIVERRGERRIWRLQAEKADETEGGRMLLQTPLLELFTESGRRIPVRGARAWFEPVARSIHFREEVVVHYEGWVLHCDELRYDSGRDRLVVPGAFRFAGEDVNGRGAGLVAHRATSRVRVNGGIRIVDRAWGESR